jgi:hypothetical protein
VVPIVECTTLLASERVGLGGLSQRMGEKMRGRGWGESGRLCCVGCRCATQTQNKERVNLPKEYLIVQQGI